METNLRDWGKFLPKFLAYLKNLPYLCINKKGTIMITATAKVTIRHNNEQNNPTFGRYMSETKYTQTHTYEYDKRENKAPCGVHAVLTKNDWMFIFDIEAAYLDKWYNRWMAHVDVDGMDFGIEVRFEDGRVKDVDVIQWGTDETPHVTAMYNNLLDDELTCESIIQQ